MRNVFFFRFLVGLDVLILNAPLSTSVLQTWKTLVRLFAYAPASKRSQLLEYTIIREKPALVATCIKQATYVKQVCIQFLQKTNTLKRTCIKQIPVLSKCNFDYHLAVYSI